MKRNPLHRVRAASTRVALVTTAIVGVVYLLVSVVVVLIVTRNLTAEVDASLTATLAQGGRGIHIGGPHEPAGLGPKLLVWYVHADGTVDSSDPMAQLPASAYRVQAPHTISIGSTEIRVIGADATLLRPGEQLADGEAIHVVIGESMAGVLSAQGTVITAEVIVGPILLVAVFLGALTIGRRVAAPIELARQRQMEFTADASHELRTPLSVIEAQTSLALSQERESAWYRQAFEHVGHESGRIRRLVEDLLWLARFDVTSGQPNAEHVDVGILAYQAADRFATVAEARGLNLSVRAAAEPMIVLAPPEWLDRLLGVLLDNACKYAPENGTVTVVVIGEGSRVRLAVEDSGPGIPVEERPRIFDRFHRATEKPGGAGLGLAIADAVVRATGGRWDVGSSFAGGASMAVSWSRSLPGSREPAMPREVSPAR